MRSLSYEVVSGKDGRAVIKPFPGMEKQQIYFEQVSARILTELKSVADERTRADVTDVVITVPANFNPKQKEATMSAAKIAKLNVMKMIPEPTAAAIAGKFKQTAEVGDTIFVIDIGGGTSDMSLLRISESGYDVLSTCGDMRLGGRDFDQVLVDIIKEKIKDELIIRDGIGEIQSLDPFDERNIKNCLQHACEKAKIELSVNFEADVILPFIIKNHEIYKDFSIELQVMRHEFEEGAAYIFEQMIEPLEKCLEVA